MQAENFLLIGNDKKMQSCQNRLIERGYRASCCESDEIEGNAALYPNIILPLPTLANGFISGTGFTIEEFSRLTRENHCIFYGNLEINPFGKNGFCYYNESFLVKNSRLTAQGVLRLVLENTEKDMYSMNAAVLGYGRCGRAICKSLQENGIRTVSVARNYNSFALAENEKLNTMNYEDFSGEIRKFDIIVNTVPCNILDRKVMERLTPKNLYIEIASKPYGFNINETDKYNFKYILAESLPGKFTPMSAGVNIADTVIAIKGG